MAQGSKTGQYDSEEHARKVKHRAKATVEYLEQEFEKKNSHLKAQTSKGSVLETISFRVEETDKTVSAIVVLINYGNYVKLQKCKKNRLVVVVCNEFI